MRWCHSLTSLFVLTAMRYTVHVDGSVDPGPLDIVCKLSYLVRRTCLESVPSAGMARQTASSRTCRHNPACCNPSAKKN